jgi:hypothetical protein
MPRKWLGLTAGKSGTARLGRGPLSGQSERPEPAETVVPGTSGSGLDWGGGVWSLEILVMTAADWTLLAVATRIIGDDAVGIAKS